MNCPTCNTELENGTWVCTETDHRILDSNGVVEGWSIVEHNIPSDDEVNLSDDEFIANDIDLTL